MHTSSSNIPIKLNYAIFITQEMSNYVRIPLQDETLGLLSLTPEVYYTSGWFWSPSQNLVIQFSRPHCPTEPLIIPYSMNPAMFWSRRSIRLYNIELVAGKWMGYATMEAGMIDHLHTNVIRRDIWQLFERIRYTNCVTSPPKGLSLKCIFTKFNYVLFCILIPWTICR